MPANEGYTDADAARGLLNSMALGEVTIHRKMPDVGFASVAGWESRGRHEPPSMFHGPQCRCGSRNTTRMGENALQRFCNRCGSTYRYVLHYGYMVPYALETYAAMMEMQR